MAKPTLRVIRGTADPCPPWLDFPPTVVALSPSGRTATCRFRLSREDSIKAASMRRLQPIWDLWSIVLGEPPPVPNVTTWGVNVPAEEGLIKLVEAHACFRGIRRAIAEDDDGENVVTYVLKPPCFYEKVTNLVCLAQKRATPEDLVYTAHARLDVPVDPNSPTIGVVTHGGFVEADRNNALLPRDYESRYAERLW